MTEVASTRRRWFRFSLRTLFVAITLLAAYLAYNVHWMRQRRELLDEVAQGTDNGFYVPTIDKTTRAPFPLFIFGEVGVNDFWFDVDSSPSFPARTSGNYQEWRPSAVERRKAARARRLFPEARLPWDPNATLWVPMPPMDSK